jgi:hypothetical protein
LTLQKLPRNYDVHPNQLASGKAGIESLPEIFERPNKKPKARSKGNQYDEALKTSEVKIENEF